jgi:hypothetical protein
MYDPKDTIQFSQRVHTFKDDVLKQMLNTLPPNDLKRQIVLNELNSRQQLRARNQNRKALLAEQAQAGLAGAAPSSVGQMPGGGIAALGDDEEDEVPRYQSGGTIGPANFEQIYQKETDEMTAGTRRAYSPELQRYMEQASPPDNYAERERARMLARSRALAQGDTFGPSRTPSTPAAPRAPDQSMRFPPGPPPAPTDRAPDMSMRFPPGPAPGAAPAGPAGPAGPAAPRVASPSTDDLISRIINATGRMPDPFAKDRAELRDAQLRDIEESKREAAGLFAARERQYGEREQRLRGEEAKLEKRGNDAKAWAIIDAGVALATTPGPAMAAAAKAFGVGAASYRTGMQQIEAARQGLMAAYDKLQDARNGTQKEQVEANAAFRAAKTAASKSYLEGLEKVYGVNRETAGKIVVGQYEQEQQNKRNAATVAGQLQASREDNASRERIESKRLEQDRLRMNQERELQGMRLQQDLRLRHEQLYGKLLEKWQKEGPTIMRQYPNIRSFGDWLLQQDFDKYLPPLTQAGGAAGATSSGIKVHGPSANQQPN